MNYVRLLKKDTGLDNVSEITRIVMIGARGLIELVLRPG